jgi:hypothetical protein
MNTMNPFRRLPRAAMALPVALFAVLLLAASRPSRAGEDALPVRQHAVEVVSVGHVLQQVFGPMPAVAGTPFLGLAILSGAALLSDTDAVRNSDSPFIRGFHDNALLAQARHYSTLPLFLSLLGLALLTYMANSGKLRGAVGKLLRAAEDSSVLVTYGLLALVTLLGATHGTAPAPRVAVMGVWSVPSDVLLSIGMALALGVMMTVRYAFDVLIWLSPFPLVDFGFETLKKLISLGFMALYFLSPAAAAATGLLVLLPAIFLYGWALRILSFAFRIVLRPVIVGLVPSLRPQIVETGLSRLAPRGETPTLAIPADALTVRGLRRREAGAVLVTPAGVSFVTTGLLRRRRRIDLTGRRLELGRALLWLELRATAADGQTDRIALPKTYSPDFAELLRLLGAADGGSYGVVKAFGRALAASPA